MMRKSKMDEGEIKTIIKSLQEVIECNDLKLEDNINFVIDKLKEELVTNNLACDCCLKPRGKVKKFVTFQPTTSTNETHFVCEKCIQQLVNKYFSKLNVL